MDELSAQAEAGRCFSSLLSDTSVESVKEKGNQLFRVGKYDQALTEYQNALQLDPTKPEKSNILKNRAACFLKMEKFVEAEQECNRALEIIPNDPKALFRRSQAKEALGNIEGAYADCKAVFLSDSKNTVVQASLARLTPLLQDKAEQLNSTSGRIRQMFKIVNDTNENCDKRVTALQNLMCVAREGGGPQMIAATGGIQELCNLEASDMDVMIRENCFRLLASVCKNNRELSQKVLNNMSLRKIMSALSLENESISAAAGHLLNAVINGLTGVEELCKERDAYEVSRKKDVGNRRRPWVTVWDHIDSEVIPVVVEIMDAIGGTINHHKVSGPARDRILEIVIKYVTRRDGVGYTIRAMHETALKAILDVSGSVSEHKSLAVTNNTRMHCALLLQKMYEDLVSDKEREVYRTIVNEYFDDLLADSLMESKVESIMALSTLLQGPIDVGNNVLARAGMLEMILAMADSGSALYTKYAVEALVHATSKKERCTGVITQATPILKQLYHSNNPSIKVRALVGLCKLGSYGGSDAKARSFADGSTPTLAKACRKFLTDPNEPDTYKWAVEGLAYLTLDAEVKEELLADERAMEAIRRVGESKDKGTVYPVGQVLVNLTNSYDKKEVDPNLVELAKFAKHHVPEEHEKDREPFISHRVQLLVKKGFITVLVKLSDTESKNSRELLARVLNAICKNPVHRGTVVQCGGAKALISLSRDNSESGKVIAAHALSRIIISTNPQLALPGERSYEVLKPLRGLLDINCSALENYEALMALTNLSGANDENLRKRMKEEGVVNMVEHYMFEEHEKLRLSAVQCMCNLVQSDEVLEIFKGENERVKLLVLYSDIEALDSEDYEVQVLDAHGQMVTVKDNDGHRLVDAAAGALAIMSRDREICHKIVNSTQQWFRILQNLAASLNIEWAMRGLCVLRNMAAADEELARIIAESTMLELLMAITVPESNRPERAQCLAQDALQELTDKALIQPIGGSYQLQIPTAVKRWPTGQHISDHSEQKEDIEEKNVPEQRDIKEDIHKQTSEHREEQETHATKLIQPAELLTSKGQHAEELAIESQLRLSTQCELGQNDETVAAQGNTTPTGKSIKDTLKGLERESTIRTDLQAATMLADIISGEGHGEFD